VTFQERADYGLSAAEVFALLNEYVRSRAAGKEIDNIGMERSPFGPTAQAPSLTAPATTDWSQLARTSADVADYLQRQGRVPSIVWLGSVGVSPEAYLQALAKVVIELAENKLPPGNFEVPPAKLAAAKYVADDGPNLWGWVIFPDGFRAPAMMALAKQQAWTIKPARIDHSAKSK
jgi:hypothetical protein